MAGTRKWGLLSTARINDSVVEPIRQAPRSELLAVASRDAGRARAYAAERRIPRAYGSYEELLADRDIGAVYVSLPNSLHAEWTIKALQAGKHVLCEKPMTVRLEELDRVEQAAARAGRTVFEAFMYLHHPQIRRLRELVASGAIGAVQLVHANFSFYLPAERATNIRLRPDVSGGSLWDVGVYPVSLAVVLNGGKAPESVWAQATAGESGVDVSMRGQMRLSAGASAQFFVGFRAPALRSAMVVGERGCITVGEPWKPAIAGAPSRLTISTVDQGERSVDFAGRNPYLCEIEAMEACALDGAAPVVPLSLSREILRTVLALHRSSASGQAVAP
jgi:D-xylose 1-dehydrogenase (NADP+, D-xylono-1,5-lactone-forming)